MRVVKSLCLGLAAGVLLRGLLPVRGAENKPVDIRPRETRPVDFRPVELDVRRDATVAAIEKAMPSVVNVATETVVEYSDAEEEFLRKFFGPYYQGLPPQAQRSIGSGVIIHEDGYILTNLHVVGRATHIWVKLADGRVYEAERMAATPVTDVALLRIIKRGSEKFTPIQFAGDDDLLLGETVMALGNPFGLGGSVTRGILSSKDRQLPRAGEQLDVSNWLQTDAAINPGNSGGPLINARGELIGINVAVFSEGHGIGFAIPIKRISETISVFFSPEQKAGLWLGARIQADSHPPHVLAVQPGSPAEKGGLRGGDTILQINGKAVMGLVEASDLLCGVADKPAELLVRRGAEQKTLTLRMTPVKDVFNEGLVRRKLGTQVKEFTPELAAAAGLRLQGGFVIMEVDDNSPAQASKLVRGMILDGINGRAPRNMVELAYLLYDTNPGDKIEVNYSKLMQFGPAIRRVPGSVEVAVR